MKGLPSSLMSSYSALMTRFSFLPFTSKEAREALGAGAPTSVILHRLRERGWADGFGKGRYRLVHPLVAALQGPGEGWRAQAIDRMRLPIIELALARLLEEFGPRLWSLLLFGSLARNQAREESDIDLLLVAEGLPQRYARRTRLLNSILDSGPIREWQRLLWREARLYPVIDIIPLRPDEALTTHPFYLDMTEHVLFLLDREGFMRRKLAELRRQLEGIGARKVLLPGGGYYWMLPQRQEAVP
ncbi:MAG: hypothetical protein C4339_06105 [Nitrososphaerota archaeon]